MRLTTKGRYAVTAMLDLALHGKSGPVSLAEISQRQDISLSYLEQLFSKLRRKELVSSVRGPGGGYQLSRMDNEIFIADVVDAVNESVDAKVDWCDFQKQVCCGLHQPDPREDWCHVRKPRNDSWRSGIEVLLLMSH